MAPVVVKGTAVPAPEPVAEPMGVSHPTSGTQVASGADDHPQDAPKTGCNDFIWAFLLYGNVAAIAAVAAIYGPGSFGESDSSSGYDYTGYVWAGLILAVISVILSGLGLGMNMCCPELMIKLGLLFVVIMSGVWMVLSFLAGQWFMGILGVIFFLIGICYARAVWSRIPFAAVNMITSATAIKANLGSILWAYIFTALLVGWIVLWSISFAGVFNNTYNCDANGANCDVNYGFLFLLFVSFFFTQQVMQGCIHVMIAGTVATWWVAPEESGCCGKGICNSVIRTLTTSFGSICFGSLLVAIVQALRALANSARQNGDAGILACIAECILACLASILEYFNKWAFIYVGVYGYPYLTAGRNVMQLFADRGWEAIIADDLVGNALMLTSLVVGLTMGGIGVAIDRTTDFFETAGGNATAVSFFIGFIVGTAIASVMLSTVASGVNTVIVMFADSPAEFERNHPELSQKMRETYRNFYPGSV
mmetsp:Transcript_51375/g.124026  ORF Transcript_51375/g.124026 Transcript_51375/m.124026 type:complete len:480 (+) Transcript_51375:221-1660(+)